MRFSTRLIAAALGCVLALPAAAQQITGAGSTFVYPILSKWSEAYNKLERRPGQLSVDRFWRRHRPDQGRHRRFRRIDAPLTARSVDADRPRPVSFGHRRRRPGGQYPGHRSRASCASRARSWPISISVRSSDGTIRRIAGCNPGVKLPDQAITVVHRSDGSGTTFNWVNYLSKVSPEWKSKVGEGTSVAWPAGVGGKGNEGVAEYVNRIKGSIGYVEYAYVLQNKMKYGLVQNQRWQLHQARSRDLPGRGGQRRLGEGEGFLPRDDRCARRPGLSDSGDGVRPDVQAAEGPGAEPGNPRLLQMGARQRAGPATSLDYVPLPPPLVKQIEAYWQAEIH